MSDRTKRLAGRSALVMSCVLAYVGIWFGLTLLIAGLGIRYFWGEISVSQMRMNLVGIETDGGGGAVVWISILGIGVAPVVITGLIALTHGVIRRRRRTGPEPATQPSTQRRWGRRVAVTATVGVLAIAGTTAFSTTVGIRAYIQAASSDYNVSDYYAEPEITGAQPRNLVMIYLESGEQTLTEEQFFELDAFEPLEEVTTAEQGWSTIENFGQYSGGGWTMSGLVSTQCGVPLKASGAGSGSGSGALNQLGGSVDSYLAGLTCVGDIFEKHDYTSVFMGGANSIFAAKDVFLKGHGYDEVKGLSEWRATGDPARHFRSDWGLSDGRLMEHAADEVDALHAESERTGDPFNLTVLTLDTHEPVTIYDYCDVDADNDVTAAFYCSMREVAGFVEHMESQGHLDDTAVVIMGDHLKHTNAGDAFQEQLNNHDNRTIFNRIWIPGNQGAGELRAGVDQLSMYPTLLEIAGFAPAEREAGLGVSAFSDTIPENSAQGLDEQTYQELLGSHSNEFYREAWSDPAGRN